VTRSISKAAPGALSDGDSGEFALFLFFERDESMLQFLEQGVAGLSD